MMNKKVKIFIDGQKEVGGKISFIFFNTIIAKHINLRDGIFIETF